MFGLGGDDKNKLKENMEEIKSMVNNSTPQKEEEKEQEVEELEQEFQEVDGDDNSETESFSQISQQEGGQGFDDEFGDEQADSFDSPEQFDSPSEDSEPQQKQPLQEEQDQQDIQETASSQKDNTEQRSLQQSGKKQERQSSQRSDNESSSRAEGSDRRSSGKSYDLNESIPEPAETKQLNVPDIDKGPLFIRRQKFESAKSMIEEMRYISREIEDVINQLERGIEEDRETERDAKDLLHRLDEDRTGVKDIISPEGMD